MALSDYLLSPAIEIPREFSTCCVSVGRLEKYRINHGTAYMQDC